MPEINHKAAEVTTTKLAEAIVGAGVSSSDLEKQIEAILKKKKVAQAEASAPKEPDWSKISEADIADPAIYIPVIEHDIPDYMNIQVKDQEYMVVWASKDQRRIGQLMAEGYEYLKKEHVHPEFKVPLTFTSDGLYEYLDVVALRVHKRILLGKRRRALEISQKQLRNTNKPPKSRFTEDTDFDLDPGMSMYDAG